MPSSSNDTKSFEDFIYLSQAMQALCIKAQTEHYRRLKGDENSVTMGAIYWQFNDIWQGPTWSSLEYGGRWKMLHYYAKDFFAPLLISVYEDNGKLAVWVTSDINRPVVGSYTLSLWSYSGRSLLNVTGKYNLESLESQMVYTVVINELISGHCRNLYECFLYLTATDDGVVASTNIFYLSSLAIVDLPAAKFSLTGYQQSGRNVTFTITSNEVAPYVFLETPIEGVFSDNGFLLFPNQPFDVAFEGWETIDNFQANLKVRTLSSINLN